MNMESSGYRTLVLIPKRSNPRFRHHPQTPGLAARVFENEKTPGKSALSVGSN